MVASRASRIALGLGLLGAAHVASADTYCTLTEFTVVTYDHGGAYLHGKLDGNPTAFITLCGVNGGSVQDCESKATDRRLALSLAAQAQGKALKLYYSGLSSCAGIPSYTRPLEISVAP